MKTLSTIFKKILGVFGLLMVISGIMRVPKIILVFNTPNSTYSDSYTIGYLVGTMIGLIAGGMLAYWGLFRKKKLLLTKTSI
jgi:hypothetical protein